MSAVKYSPVAITDTSLPRPRGFGPGEITPAPGSIDERIIARVNEVVTRLAAQRASVPGRFLFANMILAGLIEGEIEPTAHGSPTGKPEGWCHMFAPDTVAAGVNLGDTDTVHIVRSGAWVDITNDSFLLEALKHHFGVVAFSNAYSDLSGTPDLSAYADAAGTYTKAEVDAALEAQKTALLGGASAAFDTLKELHDELVARDDENDTSYTTLLSTVGNKANTADVYTKTDSDARYATAAQGDLADSAVQPAALATATSALATAIDAVDAAKQAAISGTGLLRVDGTASAIVAGDLPAQAVRTDQANTLGHELTINIPAGSGTGVNALTVTLGSDATPLGPFSAAYGYVGASLTQYVTPSAPAGGEPNADALFIAQSFESVMKGGSRGINVAVLAKALNVGHSQGGSFESGLCTFFLDAVTNTDETVFCIGAHTNITAAAGGLGRIGEFDFIATGATVKEAIGLIVVSVNTNVAAVNTTITLPTGSTIPASFAYEVVTIGSGRPFEYGFAALTANGGAQAVGKAAFFASGAPEYGMDLGHLAATLAPIRVANNAPLRGRKTNGTTHVDLIKLGTDNNVHVGDGRLQVNPTVFVRSLDNLQVAGDDKGHVLLSADLTVRGQFGLIPSVVGNSTEPVLFANGGVVRIASELRPDIDNGRNLGSASFRFGTVFAGTGTINTSDARAKTALTDIPPEVRRAMRRVFSTGIGVFRFLDAVAEKGLAARQHIGVTVQSVIEAFEAEGADPFRYAAICADAITEAVPTKVMVTKSRRVMRAETVQVPVIRKGTREETHGDDKFEVRARAADWAALLAALKAARLQGHDVPDFPTGGYDPVAWAPVLAAADALRAGGLPIPFDPYADGWRPRVVTVEYDEHVHTTEPVLDEAGAPVIETYQVTDEAGRIVIENGEAVMATREKTIAVPQYTDETVEVEIDEDYEVEEIHPIDTPVIDPVTGRQMMRLGLRESQLHWVGLALMSEDMAALEARLAALEARG